MELLEGLNAAINYIEAHLQDDIDLKQAAKYAASSVDGFSRLFSNLTGITIAEYIRRRRLTKAAYSLQQTDIKVIDIAVEYGYENSDTFCRAFKKQHGITPKDARNISNPIKAFPPISFYIKYTGAKDMDFKLITTEPIMLKGISAHFTGDASNRFDQEHIMWADHHDDIQNQVSKEIPGIWYGVWNNGIYSIARNAGDVTGANLEDVQIASGTYAVFKTEFGGFAGEELPKLRELIFDSWLKDSGFRQTNDYEVEVYHLFNKQDKHKRQYELWLPVEKI